MRILLDVDGVFADFNYGAFVAHGKHPVSPAVWDYYKVWPTPLTTAEFWEPINAMGAGFYQNIVPPFSWHGELLQTVNRLSSDLAILTANHPTPEGFAGKKWWCNKFLPNIPVAVVDHTFPKEQLANPNTVLIDDRNENVERFKDAGGLGILFPQPWNKNAAHVDNRVNFTAQQLSIFNTYGIL